MRRGGHSTRHRGIWKAEGCLCWTKSAKRLEQNIEEEIALHDPMADRLNIRKCASREANLEMARRYARLEPEKLDLASLNLPQRDDVWNSLSCFPEARTEGGKIDFDQLKRALGETVDAGKERYGIDLAGQGRLLSGPFRRLASQHYGPAPSESVNFDATENLIIEGDNLEVLKLLQKSYLGKVKMIYIDPPYNTGNDFIYPDNYAESLQTYLEYTGQVDAEGASSEPTPRPTAAFIQMA